MAEGSSVNFDDVVCRFYLKARCRDGNTCYFAHDRSRRIPDSVCRFYQEDRCQYGDRCRWDHIRVQRRNPKYPSYGQLARLSQLAASGRLIRPKESDESSNQDLMGRETMDASKLGIERSAFKNELTDGSECEPRSSDWVNRDKSGASNSNECSPHSSSWLNAPVFVPKNTRSYADTVRYNLDPGQSDSEKVLPIRDMCTYSMNGFCPFEPECPFIHAQECELCGKHCLNPLDEKQRKEHLELCEKELVKDMELSFAVQRSRDKSCGICMDVIMDKEPRSERRFGILEKCNHVFCLSCIRKWRSTKQYSNNPHIDSNLDPVVTRACPECRVPSDFITPSSYWFESDEEKKKLISDYKLALSKKPCKYFKQGRGKCPFGGACFYLHAKPDGTKVVLPPPTRRRRRNQNGELDYMGRILLLDYLELREENLLMHLELSDFEYTLSESSDNDESDSDDIF